LELWEREVGPEGREEGVVRCIGDVSDSIAVAEEQGVIILGMVKTKSSAEVGMVEKGSLADDGG
jgi:hypothetical protein